MQDLCSLLRTVDELCGVTSDEKVYSSSTEWYDSQCYVLSPEGALMLSHWHTIRDGGPCAQDYQVYKHLAHLLRGYLEVFLDFGIDSGIVFSDSVTSFFQRTMSWDMDNFVSYAKYCLSAPMAAILQNELPPEPLGVESYIPFSGKIRRFLKLRITAGGALNTALMYSIQQIKRACAVVPKSFIQKTLEKHSEVLQQEPANIEPGLLLRFQKKFELFWKGLAYKERDLNPPKEASTSASFEKPRSKGGQRTHVVETAADLVHHHRTAEKIRDSIRRPIIHFEEAPGWEAQGEDEELKIHELTRDHQSQFITNPGEIWRNLYDQAPGWEPINEAEEEVMEDLLKQDEYVCEDPDWDPEQVDEYLKEAAVMAYNHMIRTKDLISMVEVRAGHVVENRGLSLDLFSTRKMERPRRLLKVQALPIVEPLKVRVITKGESLPYYNSMVFQKIMLRHLRKMKGGAFVALSGPLDLNDILDLNKSLCKGLEPFAFPDWVSGDYSSATDLLSMTLTKMCFESFLSHFNDEKLKDIGRSVLYEQWISYPEMYGIEPFIQKNGQLMGSPLSFPILCAINFVCKWIADEEYYGRRVSRKEVACRVNGDDILFKSNPRHYEIWRNIVAAAGFQLSVGKNFVHRRYCTINSVLYDTHNGCQLDFFNVGLLTGQSKLTGRDVARTVPSWDWYNACMKGARNKLRATRRFIHYHQPWITKITEGGRYNLFISQSLGGLGFKPVADYEYKSTPSQEALAHELREVLRQPVVTKAVPRYRHTITSKNDSLENVVWKTKTSWRTYTHTARIGCLKQGQVRPEVNTSSSLEKWWSRPDSGLYLLRDRKLPKGKWTLLSSRSELEKEYSVCQEKFFHPAPYDDSLARLVALIFLNELPFQDIPQYMGDELLPILEMS